MESRWFLLFDPANNEKTANGVAVPHGDAIIYPYSQMSALEEKDYADYSSKRTK